MIVDVGALEEFALGQPRPLQVAERNLVGVRVGDEVFVLENRCSHEDFPLAEGVVDLDTEEIECARHGAMFSLRDGAPMSFPAT
ncbi:MAG: Rieske 2Fe-2S domain-containing protein, partial [Acidobacteriota bacterium]|nr:Rieske 2Fe-2S domain-containing protein [Acidobacteriota bacterium]